MISLMAAVVQLCFAVSSLQAFAADTKRADPEQPEQHPLEIARDHLWRALQAYPCDPLYRMITVLEAECCYPESMAEQLKMCAVWRSAVR